MAFKSWLILCEAVGLTIFIFGLLVWGYVVLIQVTHPEWVVESFSHHVFPPLNWRMDNTGILAFAVAAVGFLMWYLSCTYSSNSEHSRKMR